MGEEDNKMNLTGIVIGGDADTEDEYQDAVIVPREDYELLLKHRILLDVISELLVTVDDYSSNREAVRRVLFMRRNEEMNA